MNRKIVQVAAVAVIVIGVVSLWGVFHWGNSGSSIAWADVQQHIRNARTMTFKTTTEEEGLPTREMTMMFMEPGHSRLIMGDGLVWIIDNSKGKILILDQAKKTGVIIEGATTQSLSRFHMMEILRTIRADSEGEESLGTKKIEGRKVVGFLVHKYGKDITVWVDPATELPIRIESEVIRNGGAKSKHVLSNIEFDTELDGSLFSTNLPEGYTAGDVATPLFNTGSLARARQFATRAISARNMDRLVRACVIYASQHDDKWPDSLEQLVGKYGITEKHLINPNEKDYKVGYVYIKPTSPLDSGKLLMYERHVQWKDGINVVLGNLRVKFIADENDFKQLLSSTKSE